MSSNIPSNKIAIPYAEALFESSQSINLINKTREDLKLISMTIEQSNILRHFLTSPLIVMNVKKNVINNLFIDKVSAHVLNFLFILIERRRINLITPVISYYISLVNQLDLITLATVYTVIPLSEEQKQALQKTLQSLTNSKTIQLIIELKPSLIGGLVIKVGSKVIDMSIYGQLSQLSSQLNGSYL